jgi:Sec-independent protein translocase protein TatA
MEAALNLVETNEVETKALSIVDQAKAVKVVDVESYKFAGELWKGIGDMIKEVKATFDPICEAANKAHKAATTKRASFLDPLESVYKNVKRLMSDYDAEQERLRRAEEARLRDIERKAEEERRLQEAITLEESGQKEVAEAVMEAPVYVAPVVIPKVTPKMEGGPVFRTIWKFRVVNPNIIPRQYLKIDEVAIGGVVRSLKNQANIPGIEIYEERV